MSKNNRVKAVTGLVRFANVHIYEPISPTAGVTPKYSITLIISKSDSKTIDCVNDACSQVKELNLNIFNNKSAISLGLRDGDIDREGDPIYSKSYFLNASSTEKPGIVDVDLNPLIQRNDLYGGCYGRVSITFYAYSAGGRSGIAAGLNNIQKLQEGEIIPDQEINCEFRDGAMRYV